jgi:hypothetical protein
VVILMLILLLPLACCVSCQDTCTVFEWNYRYRIKVGMTLKQAEGILGPATKVDRPPETAQGPVIGGDEFYQWRNDDLAIYVGIRDGKVCDKFFVFPPLFY